MLLVLMALVSLLMTSQGFPQSEYENDEGEAAEDGKTLLQVEHYY